MQLISNRLKSFEDNIADHVCDMAEVETEDELSMSEHDMAEDALRETSTAVSYESVDNIIKAMVVLNDAGLSDIALKLRAIYTDAATLKFIKAKVF